MALLDHFHAPLKGRRHWHGFHNAWATHIATQLNRILPPEYFAEPNVQFGIEVDVAAFEEEQPLWEPIFAYAPPLPVQTIPLALITDVVEVEIYSDSVTPTLMGAIEIVSPANKDRASHRQAFVSKCASLLHQGVCVLIVDIVTARRANLHDELLREFDAHEPAWNAALYAASYRPTEHHGSTIMQIWREQLLLGDSLPTLPLWLRGSSLPVNLDESYQRTCEALRIS